MVLHNILFRDVTVAIIVACFAAVEDPTVLEIRVLVVPLPIVSK